MCHPGNQVHKISAIEFESNACCFVAVALYIRCVITFCISYIISNFKADMHSYIDAGVTRFFCGCRGFCHRTESDLFLFLLFHEIPHSDHNIL